MQKINDPDKNQKLTILIQQMHLNLTMKGSTLITITLFLSLQLTRVINAQDTIYRHLNTLEFVDEKLDYIGEAINQTLLSDPIATNRLSEIFDSLSNIDNQPIRTAQAFIFKGVAAYTNGNYEVAADYYLKALTILEGSEQYELLGLVLNNLASCYAFRNENSKSIEYYLRALDVAKLAQDYVRLALLNNNIGIQYLETQDYDAASQHYGNAIQMYSDLDQPLYVGITLLSRGNLLIEKEDYNDAITDYQEAMTLVPKM